MKQTFRLMVQIDETHWGLRVSIERDNDND